MSESIKSWERDLYNPNLNGVTHTPYKAQRGRRKHHYHIREGSILQYLIVLGLFLGVIYGTMFTMMFIGM